MKIRCVDCGRKFEPEVEENGVPKRVRCDKCRARELERTLTAEIAGVGKKKRRWWK